MWVSCGSRQRRRACAGALRPRRALKLLSHVAVWVRAERGRECTVGARVGATVGRRGVALRPGLGVHALQDESGLTAKIAACVGSRPPRPLKVVMNESGHESRWSGRGNGRREGALGADRRAAGVAQRAARTPQATSSPGAGPRDQDNVTLARRARARRGTTLRPASEK